MPYATETKVPVERTRVEIEQLVAKYKASQYAVGIDHQTRRARVEFVIGRRRVRFEIPLPPADQAQKMRSRWRALLLCIKAKLEAVDSGIESFDEAFLAHVVMPDGRRFGEITIPQIDFQEHGN